MLFNAISDWWNSLFGGGLSVTGCYFIAAVIIFVVLGLAIMIISLVLSKTVDKANSLKETNLTLETQTLELETNVKALTCARDMAKNELEETKAKLEKTEIESKGTDAKFAAYERIFKESLMIANAKSDIAIDKSEVLDVMSVDDVKAYANSIGAKATTTMTKAEMIQSIRAREVSLKSISNARSANAAKKAVEASAAAKSAKAASDIEPYRPEPTNPTV